MKKVLVALLSFFLIISMISCSGDNPEPPVQEEQPGEIEQINNVLDQAGSVFNDLSPDDNGTVMVNEDIKQGSVTVKQGSYQTVNETTGTTETMLIVEYQEDGKNVQVTDTTTETVTVDGNAVTEEQKEEVDSALAAAKAIPASMFTVSSDGIYVYDVSKQQSRSSFARAVAQENISKVIVSFEYGTDLVTYKYEVTYATDETGSSTQIAYSLTKETKKLVGNEEQDLSQQLQQEYNFANMQPGGEDFLKLAAIDLVYTLKDYSCLSNFYTDTASIGVRNTSGNNLLQLSVIANNEEHTPTSEEPYYWGRTDIKMKFGYVDSLLGFSLIKSGSEVSIQSSYTQYDEESAEGNNTSTTGTDVFSLITDGEEVLEVESSTTSNSTTTQSETNEKSTTILKISKLRESIKISDSFSMNENDEIRIETAATYSSDTDYSTKTIVYLNESIVDVEKLFSEIGGSEIGSLIQNLMGIVDSGMSFEITHETSSQEYQKYCYETDKYYTMKLKESFSVEGSVRSGLMTYFMSAMENGGEVGKDMLRYFSGLATDTDEYALDDPVNGAEKVTVYNYSRPSGESSYTIEITGGSLQGTYKNITEEEMGWY